MTSRSKRHHEIPQWHSKHFCSGHDEILWMGFKDNREVKPVKLRDAFVRKDTNTRIDYQRRADGTFQEVKSDLDEGILADFDGAASRAARELIEFSRKWRDAGPSAPSFSREVVEVCKRIIVVQARRSRESQNRVGLVEDNYELYLDLYFKRAEEVGQLLPSREELLQDPNVTRVLDGLSQNIGANMASGNHPILADKEEEFLAPLGLNVAVIDPTAAEFITGSHGITIVETANGRNTWLPLVPDVAISFSNRPGNLGIGISVDEFVEVHNRAALLVSARIAGRSERTVREWLAKLDRPWSA